jgi:hypothetical protein
MIFVPVFVTVTDNFKEDFAKKKALEIINDICSCLQTDCVRERRSLPTKLIIKFQNKFE